MGAICVWACWDDEDPPEEDWVLADGAGAAGAALRLRELARTRS